MSSLLIRGGTVVTMDARRRVEPLDVRVKGSVIAEVGLSLPAGDSIVMDASGCVVMPGLIHSHLHLCQVLFRHMAEDRPLLPWLRERIWPLEAAHDEKSLRASAELGIAELLKSGATGALDMGTVRHHDVVFEAARDLGIRLCSGKAMMDDGDGVPEGLRENTSGSIAESDRLRAVWDGAADGRLSYAYAPRFVLSCSDTLLQHVAGRVATGARLHTHASENRDEVELVRSRTGFGNVELLDRLQLLSERSTLAHVVHATAEDRQLLAERGTSVAHCPSANLKLASGVADVPALLTAGVNVGIGADGAPCNNNLDLWREMKLAGLLPRIAYGAAALPPERILEMATLGGARALGMERELGSVEAGKRADLILVEMMGVHVQPITRTDQICTALVYATQASDVRTVLVNGAVVVRERQLQTADERKIVATASDQARSVWSRAAVT